MNKSILIINGPNLNLLGSREPAIYGDETFEKLITEIQSRYPIVEIDYFQSNKESDIINCIHSAEKRHTAIVLNAGAFTHTSIAISDAVRSIALPVIEVHISNVFSREDFRKKSYLSSVCKGSICGLGTDVYRLAVDYVVNS